MKVRLQNNHRKKFPRGTLNIFVFILEFLCLWEPNTVNYWCMVQFITEDCIFFCCKDFKQPSICIKTAGIKNGIFSGMKLGNFLFKFLMDILDRITKISRLGFLFNYNSFSVLFVYLTRIAIPLRDWELYYGVTNKEGRDACHIK